jgi:hypothetical protein
MQWRESFFFNHFATVHLTSFMNSNGRPTLQAHRANVLPNQLSMVARFFPFFYFLCSIFWEGDTFEWPRSSSSRTEPEGSLLDLRESAPVPCFELGSIGPYPQDEGKFPPVHPMIAYAGMEVHLNSFMTSEINGIELSASRPACFATEESGPCSVDGDLGLRAGLDASETIKMSCLCLKSKVNPLLSSPELYLYSDWAIPVSPPFNSRL